MPQAEHLAGREPCPFLPHVAEVLRPTDIRQARQQGGATAYLAALTCAQSLWLQGLPAQAILQLNHAMSLDMHEESQVMLDWPIPYRAFFWMIQRHNEEGFLGNPVRHFQHLATRMSGSNKNLRVWRAWACFHLSESILPTELFPRDEKQISKEELSIPEMQQAQQELILLGKSNEAFELRALL